MSEILEEASDVEGFLSTKSLLQVIFFVIAAVVILLVALIWNDIFVETTRALLGDNNLLWVRWIFGIVIIVIAIIVVYISREIYRRT